MNPKRYSLILFEIFKLFLLEIAIFELIQGVSENGGIICRVLKRWVEVSANLGPT